MPPTPGIAWNPRPEAKPLILQGWPGLSSNDRSQRDGDSTGRRVADAPDGMTVAHAYTEVARSQPEAADATAPWSAGSKQGAEACRIPPVPGPAAGELLRTAMTLAAARSHAAPRMVDAHPPRRHGRYCKYTAHPK